MELKPGYKQTEVGVIPEDWAIQSLGAISSITTGRKDVNEGNPSGSFPFFTCSRKSTFSDSYSFDAEAILIAGNGDVGNLHYFCGKFEAYQRTYVVTGFKTPVRYVWHHLDYRLLDSLGIGTIGSSIPYIKKENLTEFFFPIPPTLAEQEAIAETLSDADTFIDSLQQLIVKKRLLKQGAMQDLLTGNQRLPGFEGEWETVTLADIGEVSGSGVDKKIRENEEPVRLLNYMDVYRRDFIYANEIWHTVTAPTHKARRCSIEKGDIFFTPSSEVRDDIGHSAVAMEDMPGCCYSYHVVRLRLHRPWDLKFRTYAFKTKAFMDQASVLCDGSGTRYVISQSKFRSMEVTVPSDVKEQTAIAAILSDMDTEIATLEAKLAKARQVKQGMMQELLTGKTRLV